MKKIIRLSHQLRQVKGDMCRFFRDTVAEDENQSKWMEFLQALVGVIVATILYILIGHTRAWPHAEDWFNMLAQLLQ